MMNNQQDQIIDDYIDQLKVNLDATPPSDELEEDTADVLRLLTFHYRKPSPAAQMQTLISAVDKLASRQTSIDALNTTIEEASKIVRGEGCSVWLINESNRNEIICAQSHATDGRVIPGYSSYSRVKLPNGQYDGLTAYVFATGKTLRVSNIRDKAELARISHELHWSDKHKGWASQNPPDDVRPFLAVPLCLNNNPKEVIGVVRVATTIDGKPFTETDESVLVLFATVLSTVLSHTRRNEQYGKLIRSLHTLDAIPPKVQLLDTVVNAFGSLFDMSHASILLLKPDGKYHIEATSAEHLKEGILNKTLSPYEAGDGKTGRVIATGKAILYVDERGLSSAKPPNQCEALDPAISFIAAPLADREGKIMGVIRSVRSAPAPPFRQDDLELLETFAGHISDKLSIRIECDELIEETAKAIRQSKA